MCTGNSFACFNFSCYHEISSYIIYIYISLLYTYKAQTTIWKVYTVVFSLVFQIPPEVRCFRYVFGVQSYLLTRCLEAWGFALLIPYPYTFVYIRGFHQLPRQSLRAETGFSGSGTPGIEFVKPVAGQHPTNKALEPEHKSLTRKYIQMFFRFFSRPF